jgi:serine/threonine protein kinase
MSGRYELQGSSPRAGWASSVHRVLDRATGQRLALKRLAQHPTESRFDVEAFEREYHVLASLDHPRIIRVCDYGVDDRGPITLGKVTAGTRWHSAADRQH